MSDPKRIRKVQNTEGKIRWMIAYDDSDGVRRMHPGKMFRSKGRADRALRAMRRADMRSRAWVEVSDDE